MDTTINFKDFELLAQDKYTFAVLDRILRGKCDLTISNHQNMILCHSDAPYPVWIWTIDGCPESVKEEAWKLAAEYRPLNSGFRFNMKYELAEYFINKARQTNLNVGISMQLCAYDCPSPFPPTQSADGKLHCCTHEDTELAANFIAAFCEDIGEEISSSYMEKASAYIDENAFFFWKNADGNPIACCSYKCNQGLASLGSVYTLPEYRRKHYAQHLVYRVTEKVKAMGFMPMLYTDADYLASNSCYTKIGYELRGRLCTISLHQ